MVEYIRGIKAGLASGLITGIIFSIIFGILLYPISCEISSSPIGSDDLYLMLLIEYTSEILNLSIFSGIILGIILSILIPKINIKPIYVSIITSVLIINMITFLLNIQGFIAIKITDPSSISFLTLFALVEGTLLNHFWGRYILNSSSTASSAPSNPDNLNAR